MKKKKKKERSNEDVLVKLVLLVLFLGGVAAAVTNPLDVAKTRVMLAPVKKFFFFNVKYYRILLFLTEVHNSFIDTDDQFIKVNKVFFFIDHCLIIEVKI